MRLISSSLNLRHRYIEPPEPAVSLISGCGDASNHLDALLRPAETESISACDLLGLVSAILAKKKLLPVSHTHTHKQK